MTLPGRCLAQVLRLWPDNGYAKVHLGFLRRLAANHEDAARLMQGGIDSDEPGVHSPRFYYGLSDSYSRIGEHEKSMQVNTSTRNFEPGAGAELLTNC